MSPKDTEWGLVTEMVRDHYFISGEPRPKLIRSGFSPEFVSRIPLGNISSENSVALVEAVRNSDIETQLLLLSTLASEPTLSILPAGTEATRLMKELEEAERLHISPQDFFLSRVLSNGSEVFIDRTDFRKRLREFLENPDKTVLVVDGEPDSGRSYSYKLIRHIGDHCNFRPVRVTLDRTSTAEQVVQRLAESVADPTPAQSAPANTAPSPLNPTQLNPTQLNDPLPDIDAAVHRVVNQATTAQGRYWLVLDDCDKLDVNSDVWDCIGKLALAIHRQIPAPPDVPPRLVLLGYSPTMRQLPYEIRKNEVRDTTRIFGTDDLREFFQQFFTEASTPPGTQRINDLVETTVPAILKACESPGPGSYMRKVSTAAATSVRLYGALTAGEDFGARLSEQLSAATTPDPADVSDLRKAYREAASLMSRFAPAELKLPGEKESTGKAGVELLRDCRAVGARDTVTWVLKSEVRDTALRGFAGPERARLALLANLEQIPPGPGPERTALAYLDGAPPDLADQKLDELPHTLQAVLWLAQVPGITGIPESGAVQQLLDRARLMEPLERLGRGSFEGRADELARLSAYIGLPTSLQDEFTRAVGAGTKRPVLVHGPTGVGKSALLAAFLRDSLRDFPTAFPFAYVDFARPTLSAREPATLIAEMARQLGVQFPEHHADFDALAHACEETVDLQRAEEGTIDELYGLATTRATMARLSESGIHALAGAREGMLAAQLATLVVQAVGVPAAKQPPLVLVIDSFEEAQYSGSPELGRMWGLWSALQKVHPRLRTVVAGRLLKQHPARLVEPLTIELNDLDPEASVALLVSCGVADERLAEKLADRVGGNPLSLKLAARAAEQEGHRVESLNELIESLPRRRFRFFGKVDQMLVQGTLYERILWHIGDLEVRALAQAAMALRIITPGLIRDVLAEPCGLTVDSDLKAERLFELYSRLDLVESDGPGILRHRADLRATMLRLADRARPDVMRAVGRRAVAYYAAREGVESRAEEIYHRLRLNESPREVEQRWLPGVDRFLVGADEDMAGRSAAYLAGRFGGHIPDEVVAMADQEDWERITAREVKDLLSQEYTAAAAARLEGRRPWTSGSPLHPLWVDTLDRLGRRTEARAAADASMERAGKDGFPGLQLELLLVSARLAEADGDLGEADEDLAEAEEIATGLAKDFEALGALMTRAQLASRTGEHGQELRSRLAERLRRLPDAELVRQPALVRAAVAEVSRDHPRILEHALDVVGLPETEDEVLDALGKAIAVVMADRPELRASLRSLLEDCAGPPDRGPASGATHEEVRDMLREARRLGTLDRLAGRLLALDDPSGRLVSAVAAAMGAGAVAPRPDTPTGVRPVPPEPGGADPTAESPGEGTGHRAA
ncbi:ATP-binding protein [Streptomyces sp. ISL-66]|uniref:AAA family ATPase n=1 Tax=Streptomyces sp. ISL-66 TaxID=2819186 RepID=UPI001BEB61AD|nr:ATP-binding protein [Streptomyces sp. ISL-66]MBT2468394.1 ATP-binding protein [Streptomyces sp. ISL-66]